MHPLLYPRWQLIAEYPGNTQYTFDDIITVYPNDRVVSLTGRELTCMDFEIWPHLFRKVGWWERRDPLVMPAFVEICKEGNYYRIGDKIKVERWEYSYFNCISSWWAIIGPQRRYAAKDVLPATEAKLINT